MRIDIWTDFTCPWCGLGNQRVKEAVAQFAHRDDVEIHHHSYLLGADMEQGKTEPVRTMLKRRKGFSDAQIEGVRQIEAMAEAEGLRPYICLDNQTGNTLWAHQLAAWADEQGVGDAMWEALYKAYFGEARSIFAIDSLVELAREVGLDPDAARAVMASERYVQKVQADWMTAGKLGARGVPFIVIDGRYGIAGAQPAPAVKEVLEKAWPEWKSRQPVSSLESVVEGDHCGPDGCELPPR